MRECPFCGYDEGWVVEDSASRKFHVRCKVCHGTGPKSNTREGAEDKWNGILSDLDGDEFTETLHEEAMGGVSAPMATLNNTPGVGSATPAGTAAMTGAQQYDSGAIGSGDKWGGGSGEKKKKKKKVHKIASIEDYSKKAKAKMKNGLTK